MNVRYRVELDGSERQQLEAIVAGGTCAVRRVKRAQILLAADVGILDEQIACSVQIGTSMDRCVKTVFSRNKRRALFIISCQTKIL